MDVQPYKNGNVLSVTMRKRLDYKQSPVARILPYKPRFILGTRSTSGSNPFTMIHNLNKFFLASLVLLGILVFAPAAQATHLMGADIQYECVPGQEGKYKVTFTIYRDCNGVNLGANSINVSSACSTWSQSSTKKTPKDITPVCKTSCTQCPDGPVAGSGSGCDFAYGIEQHIFEAEIDLTDSALKNCCEFTLTWGSCCRNGAITTGLANGSFETSTTINRCVPGSCNNSPKFNNLPVAMYCINQCIVMNPGITDIDLNNGRADSLVYKFIEPTGQGGSKLQYASPYSYYEPLQYSTPDGTGFGDTAIDWEPPKTCHGIGIDPQTGDVRFKATKVDQTVFAFAVEEWRYNDSGRAVMIGTIRRDMQIILVDCEDNYAPVITGINGSAQTSIDFCADRSKCFTINTFDLDRDDSVKLDWNGTLARYGATFEVIEEKVKWQKGRFCWKPTNAHVRSYPYTFTADAQDDKCPVNARSGRSFQIFVNPAPAAGYQTQPGKCGKVGFSAFQSGKVGINQYVWTGEGGLFSFSPTFIHKYKKPGTYKYTLVVTSSRGCQTSYKDSVTIDPYVDVELPNDTTVCFGTPITVNAMRFRGKAPYLYQWNNSAGVQKADDVKRSFTATKDTLIWVEIHDENGTGCTNTDTMRIRVNNPPVVNLGEDVLACAGDAVLLYADSVVDFPRKKAKYIWSRNIGSGFSFFDSTSQIAAYDSGTYALSYFDSLGCGGFDTIRLFFNPKVDVVKQDLEACEFDDITIVAGSAAPGATWSWRNLSTGKVLASTTNTYTERRLTDRPQVDFDYILQVTASHTFRGLTCTDVDTMFIRVKRKPVVTVNPVPTQCVDVESVDLRQFGSPIGGEFFIDGRPAAVSNRTILVPRNLGVGQYFLKYKYTNPDNCSRTDSVVLLIEDTPSVFAGADTFRCLINGPFTLGGIPSGGIWDGDGVTKGPSSSTFDPAKAGIGPHTLTYRYITPSGARCDGEDKVVIEVYPEVSNDPGTYPDACTGGDLIRLEGTSNAPFRMWQAADTSKKFVVFQNNAYYFSPTLAGVGTHKVQFLTSFIKGRCMVTKVIDIVVHPKPTLSINTSSGRTRFCKDEGQIELVTTQSPENGQIQIKSITAPGTIVANRFFDTRTATIGENILEFSYVDENGCQNDTTMTLIVDELPTAELIDVGPLCEGKALILQASAENVDSFGWKLVDGLGGQLLNATANSVQVIPSQLQLTAGVIVIEYSVSMMGSPCAPVVIQKQYKISPNPEAKFSATLVEGCAPFTTEFRDESTIVRDGEIGLREWEFGDGSPVANGGTVTHTFTEPGEYTIIQRVYSLDGCVDDLVKEKYIKVFKTPVAGFVADPAVVSIADGTIKFFNTTTETEDGTTYFWKFNDSLTAPGDTSRLQHSSYRFIDTGSYRVQLIARNPNGCADTTSGLIKVEPEITVFIPNAFTPNDLAVIKTEFKNEVFKVVANSISSFNMQIFNRWGELLFETTDINDGWDGNFKSREAPEGVYVYSVVVHSKLGKKYTFTGNITLFR